MKMKKNMLLVVLPVLIALIACGCTKAVYRDDNYQVSFVSAVTDGYYTKLVYRIRELHDNIKEGSIKYQGFDATIMNLAEERNDYFISISTSQEKGI